MGGCPADPNASWKWGSSGGTELSVPGKVASKNLPENSQFTIKLPDRDSTLRAWHENGQPWIEYTGTRSSVINAQAAAQQAVNSQNQTFATSYTNMLFEAAITRGLPAIMGYRQQSFDMQQQGADLALARLMQKVETLESSLVRLADIVSPAAGKSNAAASGSTLPNIASPAAPSTNP
ncbi:MAG: hypothetical protein SF069_03035 [Phycisphaerae bacterium]|nr:hypothetical protein [Phycisphaerae bacterium]